MESFEPGRQILGKYRVEGVLGKGGMGVVLRAVHVDLDAHVAIKVLSGPTAANPDVASRFLREAQATSKLRSEFVARVTDYGRIEDGRPCMVMELLEGEDYQAVLARGPLPPTDAVDAILQAAAALAEAHAAGIVHRDLKPSNLFRTARPDGSPCTKVLDFGISKVAAPLSPQAITETGNFLGTPLYMSPEQVRSPKEIDARTDVWSLGAVLHEMLTGEPPFEADTMGQLFARILETTPPSVRSLRPEVPGGLSDVVARALHKDREECVQAMRDLAALLAPFASTEGVMAARRAGIPSSPGALEGAPSAGAESAHAPSPALAETLAAAATASEKHRDSPPAPPTEQEAARATTAGDRTRDTGPSRRTRWLVPLAAGCVAAAVAAFAAIGTQRAPTAGAASQLPPAASSTPPQSTATPPAVTPAVTASAAPVATASAPPSATATATATAAAAPSSAASGRGKPAPTAKPVATRPSGTSNNPSPTSLW